MELRINVSDEKFAELVNKEMDALSVDDLQEMIRAGIAQYIFSELGQQKLISMFVEKKDWSYRGTDLLNKVLEKSVGNVKWDELTNELIDKTVAYMKENHQTMINSMLTNIFMDAFAKHMAENWQVRNAAQQIVYNAMNN